MSSIKCALIGLGRIAGALEDDPLREKPATHAGAIVDNSKCMLAGGCDPDRKKRKAFARRWRVKNVFPNSSQMLARLKPDIVHICTPPGQHLAEIAAAVKHKTPLIVCEKPLASSYREAGNIKKILSKRRTRFLLNHERRFADDYLYVKKVITRQLYGKLVSVQARLFMGRSRTPAQIMLDDGTHMLDIIRFLSGGRFKASSVGGNPGRKGGNIYLFCRCGSVCVQMECGNRDHIVFQLDLSFDRGRIVIGNGVFREYKSLSSPFYRGARSLRKTGRSFSRTHYFSGMLKQAVTYLQQGGRSPSALNDGLEVIRFLHQLRLIS
ncbi:MAG TPA: Gfo/Idh/MocA family oxidoreductase [Spirochaetota bacterium]|nr:Gfo/Idh/MocA family oxidoreductase [Spirochaetota bacterium]